jgi:uncharacterized protein YkwD
MKSSLALPLLLLFVFAGSSFAQTRIIDRDLRADADVTSDFAGATRYRVVKDPNIPLAASVATIEQQVFKLINAQRAKNGLDELQWNESLAELARVHSRDMANVKFFSHRGSDGSMIDDRADRLGLGVWRSIGENIAYMRGYDDPASLAVEKWLESSAHRNNLLGPNWKESAVGVAVTSDGTYYMTEVFLVRK